MPKRSMTMNSPPKLSVAHQYWTVDPTESVKLRIDGEGVSAEPPVTVPDAFLEVVRDYPDNAALAYEDSVSKQWKTVSYA